MIRWWMGGRLIWICEWGCRGFGCEVEDGDGMKGMGDGRWTLDGRVVLVGVLTGRYNLLACMYFFVLWFWGFLYNYPFSD